MLHAAYHLIRAGFSAIVVQPAVPQARQVPEREEEIGAAIMKGRL
jgi:hypothetical protein